MIVYSETLTVDDLQLAADRVPAVYLVPDKAYVTGARKRRIEGVSLRARSHERGEGWRERDEHRDDGGRGYGVAAMGGRRLMPQYATYNEHGDFMALVFDMDPSARIKSAVNDFNGRENFHAQTYGAYERTAV